MLKESLFAYIQMILPKHLLTRLAGRLAECRQNTFKNAFIQQFMRLYQINLSESQIENPKEFANFNEFFIRQLKPSARPLTAASNEIVSPADGQICQIGSISHDQIFQAKQHRFSLNELLGDQPQFAEEFLHGEFACFYLAPNAYHRVHMPLAGTLQHMTYIPGKLFSVNRPTTRTIPKLFARNERVVCFFKTEVGPMAVILVGAMLVGSIHTNWHGDVTPPRSNQVKSWDYSDQNIHLEKGDELGYFKMGSTVLVLFPNNTVSWNQEIIQHAIVQVNQTIGTLHGN